MEQVTKIFNDLQSHFQEQYQPIIMHYLHKYNLPTSFQELRQDVYNIQRPFTHGLETKLDYFVKDYNITQFELVILTIIVLIVVQKLVSFLICREKYRLYRDVDDRTLGWFETKKRDIQSGIFQFLYNNIPFIRNKVDGKLAAAKEGFEKKMIEPFRNVTYQLPGNPLSNDKIRQKMNEFYVGDEKLSGQGKLSGTRYALSKYESEMKEFVKDFIFHNPLHAAEFPGSRQMEAEVIKMTCKLYGSNDDFGITTQGGTESIMMGVLAHRNYYQKKKGIQKPNIIMPLSSHIAFNKACYYYNIVPIIVPLNESGDVNLKEVKKAINKNTIMIVGNSPSYAAGIQDDIPALAKLALKHDIGLHVDACLGSFIMPFAKQLGADILPYDFTVKGVTSISCDHHKYGLAPKGISLCMFKTSELRQAAYFSYSEWPGGLYATAQPAGSRSSAPIVGAWYAMMYHGEEKYRDNAKQIIKAVQMIRKEIEENIPELRIIGDPKLMVIAFYYKKGIKSSIYQLDNELHKRGWSLNGLQKPNSIHVAMTLPFAQNISQFIKDLRDSVQLLREDPTLHANSTSGSVGLYGASGEIPDSITKEKVLMQIVDTFTTLGPEPQKKKNGDQTNQFSYNFPKNSTKIKIPFNQTHVQSSIFEQDLLDKKIFHPDIQSSLCNLYDQLLQKIQEKDINGIKNLTTPVFFNQLEKQGFIDFIQNKSTQIQVAKVQEDVQNKILEKNEKNGQKQKNSMFSEKSQQEQEEKEQNAKKNIFTSIEVIKTYKTLVGLNKLKLRPLNNYFKIIFPPNMPMQWYFYLSKNPFKQNYNKTIVADCLINTNNRIKFDNQIVQNPKNTQQNQSKNTQYENVQIQFTCKAQHKKKPAPFVYDMEFNKKWEKKMGIKINEENYNLQYFSSQKQEDYEKNGWKISNINNYHIQDIIEDVLYNNQNGQNQQQN
ncbi:Pyridoxal phosphate-dependent transferase [Pseudocohnilembus persalinus]|uniref:sphinganine-1-phosphate aldolase n=1 Tax=Pseudocohnilembus persalinus TaxID=266149 RepID=A0A0V0QIY0_PSEPJ|nr:Pyridoxal phosphate-dependent transferase [Pseudocohnilembus persalinus]|eukprot:KRX02205.1 Pyridoxal phosphate-dependent transferase [Pseudocohnilembus persalinus]